MATVAITTACNGECFCLGAPDVEQSSRNIIRPSRPWVMGDLSLAYFSNAVVSRISAIKRVGNVDFHYKMVQYNMFVAASKF